MRRLVFVFRSAFVGFAAFAAALIGFGLQDVLPSAYLATSKGMVGSIVGLIASLLSIVLGLLVWTSHGQFTTQQTHLQTIAMAAVQLDFDLLAYGSEAGLVRELLHKLIARARARFWSGEMRYDHPSVAYDDLRADAEALFQALNGLSPKTDEQRQRVAKAEDNFRLFIETQATMIRSLADRVPIFLLIVVLGWSSLLFFGYGLLAGFNALALVVAALGATAVASAILLILELSDPYSGLFLMQEASFDAIIKALSDHTRWKSTLRSSS
jgi:hypothetical protein